MHIFLRGSHLLGSTLLIAGTCIGVGMLALPVATADAGFLASLPAFIAIWLFMLCTSRLIVEACMWCPSNANLITISQTLLGRKGAICCWILYLFLFYSLMVAHTVAGGEAIAGLHEAVWPQWFSSLIYVLLFAPAVFLGTRWVDRLNILLMTGVFFTFLLFFFNGFSHIRTDLLFRADFSNTLKALPVLLTAFGFQNLIPTLVTYTNRNDKLIMKAIWIGTSIPLVIYLVWQLLIHGIVPYGTLQQALVDGQNAVLPLEKTLQTSALSSIAQAFAFFAMTASFIGLAIAFFDFWADGLHWQKKGVKKVGLMGLVFAIPFVIAITNPTIFFLALTWAGGIGVALLLGIMPILFVWSGRYWQKRSQVHQELGGGKITLAILMVFCLFVLYQMLVY
jgi:tyrosine-specific transport protein